MKDEGSIVHFDNSFLSSVEPKSLVVDYRVVENIPVLLRDY